MLNGGSTFEPSPLTILIINASGKLGSGFIAYDLGHFEDGLEEVYSFDRKDVENPFAFSKPGKPYNSIISTLTHDPNSSEDVYTLVKSRGVKQILFRDAQGWIIRLLS